MNNNEKFKDYYKKSQSKSLGKEFKQNVQIEVATKHTNKRVKIKEKSNKCKIE